jgi:hypothetical protein
MKVKPFIRLYKAVRGVVQNAVISRQNTTVELTFCVLKSRFTRFQLRFSASRLILFCETEYEV